MRTGTARIFDNPLLERATCSHPAVNTVLGVALGCSALFSTPARALDATDLILAAAAAIAAWTLIEYIVHRHLFHWSPDDARISDALYLMHRYHHDFPNERARNMFPLVVSLPLALAVWVLLRLSLPEGVALAVFGTIVLCFTGYDLMHYLHHLPTTLFPELKRRHMLHHYRTPEQNFGVTSSVWDRVFGTLALSPPGRSAEPRADGEAPSH